MTFELARILWETAKPTIVLMDNKSVTRFFQTKAFPPTQWNACDYLLQFNFKIALIACSVNTAADFFSRLELKVRGKISLKIGEDNQATPIALTKNSLDFADEKYSFKQTTITCLTKRLTSARCKRMDNKPGTICNKKSFKRIYKDRRKHYVVFHEWNQSKSQTTSRERGWVTIEEADV